MKVKPNDIATDVDVQRTLNKSRVKKIADNFDPAALGVVVVSLRADGSYVVMDGQHRLQGCRLAGRGDVAIDVKVFTGLSLPDEARMFRKLNDFKSPTIYDRFRIRLVEREQSAVEVTAVLAEHGWHAGSSTADGNVSAIAVVESLHAAGVLDATMRLVTAAWGHDPAGANGALLGGVGALFKRYGETLQEAAVLRILSRLTPDQVIGKASVWRSISRRHSDAVAHWIVIEYNKSRRKGLLDPWI